jgi:3-keto steroid reductase
MGMAIKPLGSFHYGTTSLIFSSSVSQPFYAQFRSLESMLAHAPRSLGGRVLWTSSMEAHPRFYELNDWQLLKTTHSYGGSKYQVDLVASHLDRIALSTQTPNGSPAIRHFITEPGVASTNISNTLIYSFLDVFKVMVLYIVSIFFYIVVSLH